MPHNPGKDFVDALDAAIGATLTKGTDLFHGPKKPVGPGVPAKAVFVMPTGGAPPVDDHGIGAEATSLFAPTVQALVRGDQGDYDAGLILAQAVRDTGHKMSVAGYLDCLLLSSEPIWLGFDPEDHPEWSINFELMIDE